MLPAKKVEALPCRPLFLDVSARWKSGAQRIELLPVSYCNREVHVIGCSSRDDAEVVALDAIDDTHVDTMFNVKRHGVQCAESTAANGRGRYGRPQRLHRWQ